MKGVVFTEFLGFVEETCGIEQVDQLLTSCDLDSGGSYTAVGTYDVAELVSLVVELSKQLEQPVPELIKSFGHHLFRFFARTQSERLGNISTTKELMASVHGRIHVDVRKLYPDAELPTIRFQEVDDSEFRVVYESTRPFADLAEGLINESIVHFGDALTVERTDLGDCDGTQAEFRLTRAA